MGDTGVMGDMVYTDEIVFAGIDSESEREERSKGEKNARRDQ